MDYEHTVELSLYLLISIVQFVHSGISFESLLFSFNVVFSGVKA